MRVFSIFQSIDGEVNKYHAGRVSCFLRLAGCNLRCSYCDTPCALDHYSGREMSVDQVLNEISINTPKLTITGGEPLLQYDELRFLIYDLQKRHMFRKDNERREPFKITIETNGSIKPRPLFSVSYVMDYKLPSSGMESERYLDNIVFLTEDDWLKFVVSDRKDFERALWVLHILGKARSAQVAFSPTSKLHPAILAGWMVVTNVDAVFSYQLHKILWPKGEAGDEK